MPTQGERLVSVEKELELRKEVIAEQFKVVDGKIDSLHEKVNSIDTYIRNGMSKEIARQIKNGSASDQTRLGMKPETRDKIILWAMRIAVFSIAGKEGLSLLMK